MRVEGKVIVKDVIFKTSKKGEPFVELILEEPVYNSFTGEVIKRAIYPATYFPKNEKDSSIAAFKGGIVEIKGYLNSFENEKEGKMFYNIGLNVFSINLI